MILIFFAAASTLIVLFFIPLHLSFARKDQTVGHFTLVDNPRPLNVIMPQQVRGVSVSLALAVPTKDQNEYAADYPSALSGHISPVAPLMTRTDQDTGQNNRLYLQVRSSRPDKNDNLARIHIPDGTARDFYLPVSRSIRALCASIAAGASIELATDPRSMG